MPTSSSTRPMSATARRTGSSKAPSTLRKTDTKMAAKLKATEDRVSELETIVSSLQEQMEKMGAELRDLKQVGQIPSQTKSRSSSRPSSARSSRVNSRTASPARSLIKQNEALVDCQCWIEVAIGGRPKGRMIFDLFWDVAPKTCENFRALCTGEKGRSLISSKRLHYKGSRFHRVLPGFIIQGGDIINHDGTSGESIYGSSFSDENFVMKHDAAGILSMANAGPDTNGSQFFITTVPTAWLDGKNVVFGRIVEGMYTMKEIEKVGTKGGKPKRLVMITNCGIRRKAKVESTSRTGTPSRTPRTSTSSKRANSSSSRRRRSDSGRRVSSSTSRASRSKTPRTSSGTRTPKSKGKRSSSSAASKKERSRSKVFMEFSMDDEPLGRIVIELRNDLVPKTADNFKALCTGEHGHGYQGSRIHRIYHDFLIQGGDTTSENGRGGRSSFSTSEDDPGFFDNENFSLSHSEPGIISMANSGPGTNSSQFMILLKGYTKLDGKNVAFGKVIEGLDILQDMNAFCVSRDDPTPTRHFMITACGQL